LGQEQRLQEHKISEAQKLKDSARGTFTSKKNMATKKDFFGALEKFKLT